VPDLDARIDWIGRHMTLTAAQVSALPRLDGVRLACSVHLEPKMVLSVEGVIARGAAVFLTACNPATTRDAVVERLAARGAVVRAAHGMSSDAAAEAVREALDWKPTHLYEMGADLSAAMASSPAARGVRAGLEVTGSGISRLRRLADEGRFPPYPVFDCDDVPIKEGLHNRYLVGQSAWQAFTERTELSLHRKRVLVVGYGLVGQGVALAARSLGGSVTVSERDPARALFARYDGFPTRELEDAASDADVVCTATGARHVLVGRHIERLPDGCFLLNVGHRADEIDVEALGRRSPVVPFVEECRVGGKTVYLFAGGSMANLTAGQGDTLNSFDITMATMLAGLRYTLGAEAAGFPPGLHPLPRSAWDEVARQAVAGTD
jgi:adenosylhomocysteinase